MTTHLTFDVLMEWEQRKRANFVNSIGGFKSVCLIGTKNNASQTNVAIFNSIVHIGASPPLIGFFIRPDSVERHTLENILETGYYTINHIHQNIFVQAHQTSARYPRNESEFSKSNLTEEYLNDFFAPFVKESIQKIAVEFKEKIDLSINGTSLLIGEIKSVYFPQESLNVDGFIDLEASGTITCSGLDSYHTTNKLARLSYAKPDKWPSQI
jgi:flavin reductase (DIM6/NTAB) family NADH-FMN oxidoreductase RutF